MGYKSLSFYWWSLYRYFLKRWTWYRSFHLTDHSFDSWFVLKLFIFVYLLPCNLYTSSTPCSIFSFIKFLFSFNFLEPFHCSLLFYFKRFAYSNHIYFFSFFLSMIPFLLFITCFIYFWVFCFNLISVFSCDPFINLVYHFLNLHCY